MSVSIKSLLAQNNGRIRLLEAHDGNSEDIVREAIGDDGQSFHGIWMSGLTQTTHLGVPDSELLSPLERALLANSENGLRKQSGGRPLCAAYDADSGGDITDIPALIATLESLGVSMIIIEDKSVSEPGAKTNSLGEASIVQPQADTFEFARIIHAFKKHASKCMMITARVESFTVRVKQIDELEERISVEDTLQDALTRAEVYTAAGADAVMFHSKSTMPGEVLHLLAEFRARDPFTPLVVVPTTYSSITQEALYAAGANVVIYANHLMRAKLFAVKRFTDRFLGENPDFSFNDVNLDASLRSKSFSWLLRKLSGKRLSNEAEDYRVVAEELANENMKATAKDLLNSGIAAAADSHIMCVNNLLKVNSHQVSDVEELIKQCIHQPRVQERSLL